VPEYQPHATALAVVAVTITPMPRAGTPPGAETVEESALDWLNPEPRSGRRGMRLAS
jgi:hypothetical protein